MAKIYSQERTVGMFVVWQNIPVQTTRGCNNTICKLNLTYWITLLKEQGTECLELLCSN